jgi:outer membrane immunogenic protein
MAPGDYEWTGFYIGAHVGDAWSTTSGRTVNTATGSASAVPYPNTPNWQGGIQLGYDYMLPSRVVFGAAADVSSGGIKVANITDASGTSANELRVFDSESLRGRLGYAFDNVLVYGTAGWAWSSNQYIRTQLTGALNLATAGTDEAVNAYLQGWTAGGGVAVALAQNWNVFAEYRYTDYGSLTVTLPFSQLSTTMATKTSAVDVGVNYKFSWGEGPGTSAALVYKAPSYAEKVALLHKAPALSHTFAWTGLYVGGDGGFGWNKANGTLTNAAGTSLAAYDENAHGPLSGVFVGGNYQFGQFVTGLEGDWQWSSLLGNNEIEAPLGAAGAFPGGPFTISTTIKDYESVRARLGFAFDRFLVFGTGGWAWGDPSVAYAVLGSAPFATNSGNRSGWTAGAGLDYAVTDHVFGRIEYRYTDLAGAGFVNVAADAADAGHRTLISDLRVGFAYKFGGGALVTKD